MTIRGGNPASFRLAIASRSSMRGTAPPPSVAVPDPAAPVSKSTLRSPTSAKEEE